MFCWLFFEKKFVNNQLPSVSFLSLSFHSFVFDTPILISWVNTWLMVRFSTKWTRPFNQRASTIFWNQSEVPHWFIQAVIMTTFAQKKLPTKTNFSFQSCKCPSAIWVLVDQSHFPTHYDSPNHLWLQRQVCFK